MTKQIKVGKIRIGGGAPVSIQSMTKTDTRDVEATIEQIKALERSGCEIVRLAVKDIESAKAIRHIKKKVKLPVAADIHFNYKLAMSAIENGADKIRLNPGNIYKEEEISKVVKLAKKMRIPIRVGVNSGSLRNTGLYKITQPHNVAMQMVESALNYTKLLEKMDFHDIIVSLKASNVLTTIDAYRNFSKKSDYPLHLGVTAAGPMSTGLIKSSIGIGILLLEGIGDTIRVSLTGDPSEEVIAAKNILQSLELRSFGPEIISCPTCGRCQVDLQKIVAELEARLTTSKGFSTVAIMGCEVNGPGEAKEADIGIAFGKGAGVLFKKGRIVKRIKAEDAIKVILSELK